MNQNEIIEKLDSLYGAYLERKNKLYEREKKEVVKLLNVLSRNGEMKDIAVQLARFPGEVTGVYFEGIIKHGNFSIETIDELLQSLYTECDEAKDKQHNVNKYANAVSAILMGFSKDLSASAVLPKYVGFIAGYAEKSEKNQNRFQSLVGSTKGKIYQLDYSNEEKKTLESIWNVTCKIYPEISVSPYCEAITAWAEKYGFVNKAGQPNALPEKAVHPLDPIDDKNETPEVPEQAADSIMEDENNIVSEKKNEEVCEKTETSLAAESTMTKDEAVSAIDPEHLAVMTAEKTIAALSKENQAFLSAVRLSADNVIRSVGEMIRASDSIKQKANQYDMLKTALSESEQHLVEQKLLVSKMQNELDSLQSEHRELIEKYTILEKKHSELEEKLKSAYTINSREASLEAERIRNDLKKSFAFLYEDWLDYEFSDVSEENFESLQAIIKKVFRVLERNGINYKESAE